MSTPAPRASNFLAQIWPHSWWFLLLAALALLWWATDRRIERVQALTNSPTWSADFPQRDADSLTGYENSQRKLIVPGHHNPSYWWITEAQISANQGSLRLRHIAYDAAPDGRDIDRTAPYRGWLIAVGWLYGAFHEGPLGYAIEQGALFADPLLLALMLALGAAYTARYLGSFAALGFVAGGICLFPLASNFQPGAPDPHSLAWALALASLLPLLAALRPKGDGMRRPVHFALAGIFGGLGLWNDATSHAPVLLGIVAGGVCYELIRSRDGTSDSSPWRAWAIAGGLTALGGSVFELAPDRFSWSLDVVSPVHALAWWGFGEALRGLDRWAGAGRKGFGWRSLSVLALAALAIASWPTAGALSDTGSLLASDFYARELANHSHGGLASSLGVWLDRASGGAKLATLLPSGLLVVLGLRIIFSGSNRSARARLSLVLVVGLFAVTLAFLQLRWWNLFDVIALAMLAALFAEAQSESVRTQLKTLAAPLLALPGLFIGFPSAVNENVMTDVSPSETQALIERDYSYWLQKRVGEEPVVLFSTPMFSTGAAFYGGFDVVVSSDNENQDGQLAAVRISSADTAQEVSILLNARGITHIALPLWDPMLDQLVRVGTGAPVGEALPPAAFSVALREWDVPPWLRAMNYSIPQDSTFQGFELRSFATQAEQPTELALSRLADLFVERGMLWEAQSLREALTSYPRNIFALGAIARIDFALRESERLADSLDTLIPYMSRRSARDLPVDRRISLGALFFQTKHADLARDQVTAAFEELDAATLRTLTPATVASLLVLCRSLDIPFPNAELRAAALELIPPTLRERLDQ